MGKKKEKEKGWFEVEDKDGMKKAPRLPDWIQINGIWCKAC